MTAGGRLVIACVTFVHDHRSCVPAVEQVVDAGEAGDHPWPHFPTIADACRGGEISRRVLCIAVIDINFAQVAPLQPPLPAGVGGPAYTGKCHVSGYAGYAIAGLYPAVRVGAWSAGGSAAVVTVTGIDPAVSHIHPPVVAEIQRASKFQTHAFGASGILECASAVAAAGGHDLVLAACLVDRRRQFVAAHACFHAGFHCSVDGRLQGKIQSR